MIYIVVEVILMKNNLVNSSIKNVIKDNVITVVLLILIIIGVVIISLLPPQILRKIIDESLVPRKIGRASCRERV